MKNTISAKILGNIEIARGIHKIEIERTADLGEIKAGQFLHIKCQAEGGLLLRRPISIAYTDHKKIGMVIRKTGKGTEWLCNCQKEQLLDILGPLGNGFFVDSNSGKVIVIGGGIGTAPLLELVKQLKAKDVTVLLGYKDAPYLVEEFREYEKNIKVATESGIEGYKGYVTELLKKELHTQKADVLYACGPEVMLKEVQKISAAFGIPAQLLVEERMACGIGACLVCTCKTKVKEQEYKYVRTCKDGPVFWANEVIFDA